MKSAAAIVLCVAIVAIAGGEATGRTRTLRGKMQSMSRATVAGPGVACDTIVGKHALEAVEITGYDKPLNSNRETFMVTNRLSSDTIAGAVVTINYTDLTNRQLHRCTRVVRNLSVPPGQTRRVAVPSWDVQKSYYYRHSGAGRTNRHVSPYEVAVRMDTVYVLGH